MGDSKKYIKLKDILVAIHITSKFDLSPNTTEIELFKLTTLHQVSPHTVNTIHLSVCI